MEIDRDGFEVLDRSECFRLLKGAAVGRIAVTSKSLPLVLPLSYVVDGESIVVETGRGNDLESATAGSVVGFEVDNLHERGHSGWTVMVTGVAQEVREGQEIEHLRPLLATNPDAMAGHERFVRISSELVTGRRTDRRHRHSRYRSPARMSGHR
jgi:nitroimidazol reductase NimA-like FMN-containing flavoprotein (pyridoxamine 5'-phosphate oxidase superfamily)